MPSALHRPRWRVPPVPLLWLWRRILKDSHPSRSRSLSPNSLVLYSFWPSAQIRPDQTYVRGSLGIFMAIENFSWRGWGQEAMEGRGWARSQPLLGGSPQASVLGRVFGWSRPRLPHLPHPAATKTAKPFNFPLMPWEDFLAQLPGIFALQEVAWGVGAVSAVRPENRRCRGV